MQYRYPELKHYRLEISDPAKFGKLAFEHLEEESFQLHAFNLANHLIDELQPVTILESEEIRIYNGGMLAPFGQARIAARLEELERESNTVALTNLVLHHVRAKTSMSLVELNQPSRYINVKNGVVDIDSTELIPHNRNLATLEQFRNIVFDPNARCSNFIKALKKVQPDPAVRYRILKSFALCFDKSPMKRQIDLWIGEPDTGKSSMLRVLGYMLGIGNTAHEDLQALSGEDAYARAQIFGKAANICADLERIEIKEAGKLKELVGGDTIRARFIYHSPFDFIPYQKFFFSCNKPPWVDPQIHDDLAFWERFRITFWRRQFSPDEIACTPKLVDELDPESGLLTAKQEISGLFNQLLGILRRIRQGGDYGYRFNAKETRETWLSQIDFVQRWINEDVIVDGEKSVGKALVKKAFHEWRTQNRVEDSGEYDFNTHLSKIAHAIVGKSKTSKGWVSRRIWKGITLKSLQQQEQETLDDDDFSTFSTASTHNSPKELRQNSTNRGEGLSQASVENVEIPDSLRAWFSDPLRYSVPSCQVCGHEFPTLSALQAHLKIVDGHQTS